jgi:hypothetical protein
LIRIKPEDIARNFVNKTNENFMNFCSKKIFICRLITTVEKIIRKNWDSKSLTVVLLKMLDRSFTLKNECTDSLSQPEELKNEYANIISKRSKVINTQDSFCGVEGFSKPSNPVLNFCKEPIFNAVSDKKNFPVSVRTTVD